MIYSVVIQQILLGTDEGFVGASEDRAREHFRGAVVDIILSGEYTDEDIRGLRRMNRFVVPACDIDLDDIDPNGVLKVEILMIPPEDPRDVTLSQTTLAEVRRWSTNMSLRPGWRSVKWYPIGNQIFFVPAGLVLGQFIDAVYVLQPPAYSAVPSPDEWEDGTDMLEWFSYGFLIRAIRRAQETLKVEVT